MRDILLFVKISIVTNHAIRKALTGLTHHYNIIMNMLLRLTAPINTASH